LHGPVAKWPFSTNVSTIILMKKPLLEIKVDNIIAKCLVFSFWGSTNGGGLVQGFQSSASHNYLENM
jgi:hypothetical protein